MLTKLKVRSTDPEHLALVDDGISTCLQDRVYSPAFRQTEEFVEDSVWLLVGSSMCDQVWRNIRNQIQESLGGEPEKGGF